MTNEEKNKNEAIPLGGNTADITAAVIQNKKASAVAKPEKPKKNVNPAVVVILAVAALLIALGIAAGVFFALATTDTMPKAPLITSDMSTVVKDSALEMLNDKKITFTSDEVNLFLKTLTEKSADKLAENDVRINDLFVVIADDNATLYCRATYKGITWPIKAVATISYDDPYIVIGFSSAKLGKLELPTDMLMEYVSKNVNSKDIAIHNGFIYYDTTTFNDILSDVTLNALGLTAADIGIDDDASSNENNGFSFSKWWNKFINGISESFKNWAAGVVSDFIHDINFDDVKIIDNEIVISVSFGDQDTAADTAQDTTQDTAQDTATE